MRLFAAGRPLRLRSGAAVAVAVGLLTAGLAAPAFAADDPPQTDQLSIDEPYEQTLPLGIDGGEPQSRPLGVGIYHDNANFTVTDGRLTIDVSGLTGVAEVTWPDNCTPSGTSAVCDVPVVPVIDGDYANQVLLTVRAADGAAVGAQGRITYEATATGGPDGTLTAPHESSETTLTVGSGPDLTIDPIADIEDGQPGDERTIPLKITNNGNENANGFTVQLYASYGLTDLTRYDACTYTVTDGNDYPPSSTAICTFDQVLAPGDSFELPAPLTVRLAPRALNERLDIDVEPGDGAQDIDSGNDYVALQIGAENTADFSVTGDAISGAAGETATAELTFKNNGPAWFAHLGSGDPVAEVRLIVPEGTRVTGVPSGCSPRTLAGGYYPKQTGAPRYDCDLRYWVLEDTQRTFAFSVRVDTVVPGATGAVSIHPSFGEFGQPPFDFDPDLTNNTAALTVN
ncbi:CARDB domain-containing protein [Streptomyces sp. NPDC057690]|uniref:CARDB domain-containing protein n=1 Tax=Streptomyces sp. NPDC057690 TaxID=3346214 RepID=UPI003686A1AF